MRPGTEFEYIPGQFIGISTANIAERYYSIASFDNFLTIHIIVTRVAAGAMSDFLFSIGEEKLITVGPSGKLPSPRNA